MPAWAIKLKPMKYFVYLFFLALWSHSLFSQTRYQEEITDSVSKETYTYTYKDGEELKLDIYLPAFDTEDKKAVLLFVHGGGFSGGARDNKVNQGFCKKMAQLGYAAVSMSYRLTRKGEETGFGCNCPAEEKMYTFEAAVEDVQDATYFLIDNRRQFGIDPHKIILMGSSAGAETALNAAYKPENCYDLPSGPVSYAGVISLAGAIPDTTLVYDGSAVPSLLFHGTCDNLVPYATAPHHYCDKEDAGYIILHGAKTIADKLEELNIPYWLHTTCGGGHELAGIPKEIYFNEIAQFCYEYVIHKTGSSKHTIIPGNQAKCKYEQFDFCNQ